MANMEIQLYALLADALVLAHLLFILFVVGGGFLLLTRPRLAWLHLPAATWGAMVEFMGWTCPLTPLENHFRQQAGGPTYSVDFVARYVHPLIYPEHLTQTDGLILGSLVVAVNLVAYALALGRYRNRTPSGR